MLVYSFRIGHISQHHLAHLQRRFAEPDLQDLDIPPLAASQQISHYVDV
jgi:hypothetical protein